MAYTKTQTLNEFCSALSYDSEKLQNETKEEFLARKQDEWAISIVAQKIQSDRNKEAQILASNEIMGLNI